MKITHWKFSTLRNLFIELHDVKKSGKEEIKIITLDNLEFYLSDMICVMKCLSLPHLYFWTFKPLS